MRDLLRLQLLLERGAATQPALDLLLAEVLDLAHVAYPEFAGAGPTRASPMPNSASNAARSVAPATVSPLPSPLMVSAGRSRAAGRAGRHRR